MKYFFERVPGIGGRRQMNIKSLFEQIINLVQKCFRRIIRRQNRSLHGHHADGKLIRVFRLKPFSDLLRQPCLTGLPWRPDGKIMAAFIVAADQRIQTMANQLRAGYKKMAAGIYRAIGMESAHGNFLLNLSVDDLILNAFLGNIQFMRSLNAAVNSF